MTIGPPPGLRARTTLIQGATVIAMDDLHGSEPFRADILIEGDRIRAVDPTISAENVDLVIDGRHRIAIPGLVNAHTHSWEALFKGRYDNLPLELWMLLSYPIIGLHPLSARLIHLRTLLVGMESLRNGVTSVVDDVIEMPTQSSEALAAVFDAYELLGIRASCSGNIVNRRYIDTIPYVDEVIPAQLLARARERAPRTTDDYIAFSEDAIRRHHGRAGRLRYVIAPSGPQRCTDDLLLAAAEMAQRHDTALHIHVLETKVQAVTGHEFYGKTLVGYLDDLGVLGERMTLAHGIWVTDDDVRRLAGARASVVHNPISNQKLGAGIVRWRDLVDSGVNVALGSDGLCSNDSARMFDVMKSAALLHKVATPDHAAWPTATEVLWAATRGGARSARLSQDTGEISTGKKADVVLLDRRSINFTPENDLRNHLVYCENGESVREVIVNGELVVEDGACLHVDEETVLEEFRAVAEEALRSHSEIEALNEAFVPYFAEIHRRCCAMPLEVNRYSGDETTWLRRV